MTDRYTSEPNHQRSGGVWHRYHSKYSFNPRDPRAIAVCDRCGSWVEHEKLHQDLQWAGSKLEDKKYLVCAKCVDMPAEQLRRLTISGDPLPVLNARVEPFSIDER